MSRSSSQTRSSTAFAGSRPSTDRLMSPASRRSLSSNSLNHGSARSRNSSTTSRSTSTSTIPDPSSAACSRRSASSRRTSAATRARSRTTASATAPAKRSPARSESQRSTRSSASGWSRNSRCAGATAEPTSCYRSGRVSSTTSPTTSPLVPRLQQHPRPRADRRVASHGFSRSPRPATSRRGPRCATATPAPRVSPMSTRLPTRRAAATTTAGFACAAILTATFRSDAPQGPFPTVAKSAR
jgi:hypothetical protein